MKKKAMKTMLFIASLFFVVILLPGTTSAQEATPDELRLKYGQMVDDVIVHCDAKRVFHDTRSENIRKAVALAVMKGAFLETYREALVQEMLDKGVRPTPVTVQFFLNNRFHSLVH